MRDYLIRPLEQRDVPLVEEWRAAFTEADLALPYGYERRGVETAAAEQFSSGNLVATLTARNVVVLDPLIRNPQASAAEIAQALPELHHALCYQAQKLSGAIEAYTRVPKGNRQYIEWLKRCGYEEVDDSVTILFHRLTSRNE